MGWQLHSGDKLCAGFRATALDQLRRSPAKARTAMPALVEVARDKDLFFRRSSAVDVLVALLKEGTEIKAAVTGLLGSMEQFKEPERTKEGCTVRNYLVEALNPRCKDAVPVLIAALKDERKFVRQMALESLGKIGPAARDAVPALIEAIQDKDLKRTASEALKLIDAEEAKRQGV